MSAITIKDTGSRLEDLLATDDLFVEYFNAFLSLPTFPEPLCFNKESGGFEVINDARQKIAQEIKAAIRAGRRRKRIYRPVKQHSYSDIPLIPIEEAPPIEEREIETSYMVKTLNKEQGIEWVKMERLPAFLESNLYLEYRLAKILSQVKLGSKPQELTHFHIDYRPRPRKKKQEVVEEEPKVDEGEILMQNCYVSMGAAPTTDTEAWVSQAKMIHETTITSSASRPKSALAGSFSRTSGRPTSAVSFADSGFASPSKSSLLDNLIDVDAYASSLQPNIGNDSTNVSKISIHDGRPVTPLSSDQICIAEEDLGNRKKIAPIYSYPIPEEEQALLNEINDNRLSDKLKQVSVNETKSNDAEQQGSRSGRSSVDSALPDDTQDVASFEDVNELGSVIVASVLKQVLSEITGQDPHYVQQNPQIKDLYPDRKHIDLTVDNLQKSVVTLSQDKDGKKENKEDMSGKDAEDKEESDEDSLLNSDEDYEEGDEFFRPSTKGRRLSFSSKVGLNEFKQFLKGTAGEKYFSLWLDIDRARFLSETEEKEKYVAALRKKYQKFGSPCELPLELQRTLGLTEPSQWTLTNLMALHNKIAEPLVLYWGPRFLSKQGLRPQAKKNGLYQQQQAFKKKKEPYPNPPTITLLPLRPKTCMPRIRQEKTSVTITEAFPSMNKDTEVQPSPEILNYKTTPHVGMRRVHTERKPSAVYMGSESAARKFKSKVPKELIAARLKSEKEKVVPRPPSAPQLSRTSTSPRHGSQQSSHDTDIMNSPSVGSIHDPPSRTSSRPASAASVKSVQSVAQSDISEYLGGNRMEALLQALNNETNAGRFLRRFLDRTENQLWLRCLWFWEAVQDYRHMFYAETLDVYHLKKKAQIIHARYIVETGPHSIRCQPQVRRAVRKQLNPPFEDLFDLPEEYALEVLFEAWSAMLSSDLSTFDKIELTEVKRQLDVNAKCVVTLQRRGIIKERPLTPDDPMEGYQDPVYDETLLEKIPEEFRDVTLDKLVHNRLELEHFRQFLADNYASMDLMCWMDIEAFKRIPHTEEPRRDMKAKDIKVKYMNKKYFFGPNSPAGKEGQDQVMQVGGGWGELLKDRPPSPSILEMQKYVQRRLELKWLPQFLATEEFADRQRPRSGMDDVVEDVMLQRKKRSQAIWKMLESKWVSSSKDILAFRKALLNPVTSLQFRRYVSIKGDNLENDVLFWLEVQKYKDVCHTQAERAMVQQKTAAIINCFIDSNVPPSLQIDIPQEQADRILERRLEATPYIFREAQLTVFRVLFAHWTDFCTFRTNLAEDKVLPTIERHRRRARAKEREMHRKAEEFKEREEARRQNLGLKGGEESEDYIDPFKDGGSEFGDEHLEKGQMSWSYSQYVRALEKETVLNNVDQSTFSSLQDNKEKFHNPSIDRNSSPLPSRAEPHEGKMDRKEEKTKKSKKPADPDKAVPDETMETKAKPVKKKVRIGSPKERVKAEV